MEASFRLSLAASRSAGYNPLPMEIEPSYQQTLNYLYSFVDYSLTHNLQFSPEKFNLERMHAFTHILGDPHQSYPSIHVAGTKGKGSVAALCASALQAGGYRVGLYTSPHLSDYAERIQVNGAPIPHADLVTLVDEIRPLIDQVAGLTTFEITTALAMLYFARQGVTAAVFEVGLGGRLDATNIITPRLAIITSLSYDHMAVLGDTLAKIAAEKAGIIKPGTPVITSPQPDEARFVLEQVAQQRQAPLIQVGRDYGYKLHSHSLVDGQRLSIWPIQAGELVGEPVDLHIPLLGNHQLVNAATAFAALRCWRTTGLPLATTAIQAGFAAVNWPARFELLQHEPPVLVDSAHNRDSAARLRQAVDDYFGARPMVLIFGASEDKDIEGMLAELLPRTQLAIFTRSTHPRAADPAGLLELASQNHYPAIALPTIEEALQEALRRSGGEALVLAAGSLFIAAAVRDAWHARSAPESR